MNDICCIPKGMTPELLPSRDAPYRLCSVYERVSDGCREELVLQWEESCLFFRADPDSDSLEVLFHPKEFKPSPENRCLASDPPWLGYVGKECGWTWIAVNQQGYCDSALLSFDGIIPSVLLHVIGSSIQVFAIQPTPCGGPDRR